MKTLAVSEATHSLMARRKLESGASSMDALLREMLGAGRPSEVLAGATAVVARIARAHGVQRLRLFGSCARGEDEPGSDLDLLVDWPAGKDLVDTASLQEDLAEALGVGVDVVTPGALHPSLRKQVLAEAVEVWRAR